MTDFAVCKIMVAGIRQNIRKRRGFYFICEFVTPFPLMNIPSSFLSQGNRLIETFICQTPNNIMIYSKHRV